MEKVSQPARLQEIGENQKALSRELNWEAEAVKYEKVIAATLSQKAGHQVEVKERYLAHEQ